MNKAPEFEKALAGALAAAKKGFKVIPLSRKVHKSGKGAGSWSKRPLIERWPHLATNDPEQIRKWANGDFTGTSMEKRGPAFCSHWGGTLEGLFAFDTDAPEAEEALRAIFKEAGLPDILPTYTTKSGRGGHHYVYRQPEGYSLGNSAGKLADKLDTRGGAGGQIVLPGTRNPATGGEYVLLNDAEIAMLPVAVAEIVKSRIGDRKRGSAPGESETPGAPGTWNDFATILDEVISSDPIPCGQRDTTLFARCCEWKERGVNLAGVRHLLSIMDSLGKIEPGEDPLDDADFDRISRSAWRKKSAVFGSATVESVLGSRKGASAEAYDANTLMHTDVPEIEFLVDDLLPKGLSVVGGAPKVGKTYFNLQLAVSLASGTPFLGHTVKRKVRVLYCYLEGGKSQVKRRLIDLYGPEFEAPVDLLFLHELPALTLAGFKLLGDLIKDHRVDVVILDTWQCVRVDDGKSRANAYQKEYKEIGDLRRNLVDGFGVSVILTHHMSKAADRGDDQDFVTGLNGSTAIPGACDSVIKLQRDRGSDTALMKVTGRDVREQIVELIKRSPMGWDAPPAGNSFVNFAVSPLQKQIEAELRKYPEGADCRTIAKAIPGAVYNSVLQQLRRWVNDGKIDRAGKKFRLYEFSEEEDTPSKKHDNTI